MQLITSYITQDRISLLLIIYFNPINYRNFFSFSIVQFVYHCVMCCDLFLEASIKKDLKRELHNQKFKQQAFESKANLLHLNSLSEEKYYIYLFKGAPSKTVLPKKRIINKYFKDLLEPFHCRKRHIQTPSSSF